MSIPTIFATDVERLELVKGCVRYTLIAEIGTLREIVGYVIYPGPALPSIREFTGEWFATHADALSSIGGGS